MSIVTKIVLVLLWLVFLACIGAVGLFIAYFMGVYLAPVAGATLAVVLAGVCLLLWRLYLGSPAGVHFLRAAGVFLVLAPLIPLGYDRFVVNRYEAIRDKHFRWHAV